MRKPNMQRIHEVFQIIYWFCAALIAFGLAWVFNKAHHSAGDYWIGFASLGIGVAGFFVAPKIRRRWYNQEAVSARFSYDLRKSIYADDQVHEYRILAQEELPAVDHYFYDINQEILLANGFRLLGNVENAFLTKKFPRIRTYTRVFCNTDGTIVAGLRHQPPSGPKSPGRHTIEFQTEFSDGTYLITNNTSKAPIARPSPGIMAIFYTPQTPCEELLRIHSEAIAFWKIDKPHLTLTLVHSADDYIHFVRRFDSLIAKNEQAKGFVKTSPQEAAARSMLEQNRALWGSEPHEIRMASLADFPNLDHAFYDQYRQQLESMGFRFLADWENMTLSRVFPQMRTMLRVMVSTDGSIRCAAYHIRNLNPQVKTYDFETELSDGTFLTTSNARDRSLSTPGIDSKKFPTSTSLSDLLQFHQQRLAEKLATNPTLKPMLATSIEDNLKMQNRQQQLQAKHKRETGFVNAEDIKKIKGRQLLPQEQDIVVELERLKAIDEEQANSPSG